VCQGKGMLTTGDKRPGARTNAAGVDLFSHLPFWLRWVEKRGRWRPCPAPAQCENGTDQSPSSLFARDSGEPARSSTRGEELRPDQHRIHRESPGALRAALPNSTLVTPASSTMLLPPPMGKRRSNTAVGSPSARDILPALGSRTAPRDLG
jgi:hypothetical protein